MSAPPLHHSSSIKETIVHELENNEAVASFKYDFWSKASNKLTYEQLKEVEKTRRSLLTKQKHFNPFKIGTSMVGTVFPRLLRSRLAWSMVVLFIILRILLAEKVIVPGDNLPNINSTVVSVIGGFMSFFLVFFLGQAYARFTQQYDCSMRIEGRIFNLCFLAKIALPPGEAWRLVRYINTIHLLGYVGLGTAYNDGNLFRALNDKHSFVTEKEIARLRKIGMDTGGGAYREVIGWSLDVVYESFRRSHELSQPHNNFLATSHSNSLHTINSNNNNNNGDGHPSTHSIPWDSLPVDEETRQYMKALHATSKIHQQQQQQQQQQHPYFTGYPSSFTTSQHPTMSCMHPVDINTMQNMVNEILALRGAVGTLYDFADQTIPLAYLHLAMVICFMYLVVITYTIATYLPISDRSVFPHLLGVVLLVINLIFVIGVRELGHQIIDPFSSDLSDLSVMHYIEFTFTASRKILCGQRFSPAGRLFEEEMEATRPDCGEAFREPPMHYALNAIYPEPPYQVTPTCRGMAMYLHAVENDNVENRKKIAHHNFPTATSITPTKISTTLSNTGLSDLEDNRSQVVIDV